MEHRYIPVVFTPDENYIFPTCVAVFSMLKNRNENTKYKFYFVISVECNMTMKNWVSTLEKKFDEFYYEIIVIDDTRFRDLHIFTGHLTISAFFRLMLAEIISDDYCQYHDGDILALDDLSDMIKPDMHQYLVSGVPSIYRRQDDAYNKKHFSKWIGKGNDEYIFSGDLVFNLEKIRKEELCNKFYKEMVEDNLSEDQDVINKCCYGNIGYLPLRFCMLSRWTQKNVLKSFIKQIYTDKELKEAYCMPAIIHFAGNLKPWNDLKSVYADVWWEYAKELLSETEYEDKYNGALVATRQRDWPSWEKVIKNYTTVVVVGCGAQGKNIASILLRWNLSVYFCDNNVEIQEGEIDNIEVLSYEEAVNKYRDALWVISIIKQISLAKQQLLSLGVKQDDILIYEKNQYYYQVLDKRYYEDELREIMVKEKIVYTGENKLDEMIVFLNHNQEIKNALSKKYFFDYWIG